MNYNLEIHKVTVLTGKTSGGDQIIMDTRLPEGRWPYAGLAQVVMMVAHKTGAEYVRKHMGFEPIVIEI